jgi:hypothetical protein
VYLFHFPTHYQAYLQQNDVWALLRNLQSKTIFLPSPTPKL